jgi:hypothetical protein
MLFSFTANLLKIRLHSRADHPVELALVVSVERRPTSAEAQPQSALFTYQFHGLTGTSTQPSAQQQTCHEQNTCPDVVTPNQWTRLRSPDRVTLGAGHVLSIQLVDTHLSEKLHATSGTKQHSEQSYYQHNMLHYLLIHSHPISPRVSLFPPISTPHVYFSHGSSLYTHTIHRGQEREGLSSFTVGPSS